MLDTRINAGLAVTDNRVVGCGRVAGIVPERAKRDDFVARQRRQTFAGFAGRDAHRNYRVQSKQFRQSNFEHERLASVCHVREPK